MKEKQAKIDAWKFKVEMNQYVSSVDDARIDSVARKSIKEKDDNRIKKNLAKKYVQEREIDIEIEDIYSVKFNIIHLFRQLNDYE